MLCIIPRKTHIWVFVTVTRDLLRQNSEESLDAKEILLSQIKTMHKSNESAMKRMLGFIFRDVYVTFLDNMQMCVKSPLLRLIVKRCERLVSRVRIPYLFALKNTVENKLVCDGFFIFLFYKNNHQMARGHNSFVGQNAPWP